MPETIFIGPERGKMEFKHVMFQVMEKDDKGIPTLLRMLGSEETVDTKGNGEFMVGYVSIWMTRPHEERRI